MERTKLLQVITDPKVGDTVGEIHEWVKLWRRYVSRSVELNLVLPDSIVLVGVLHSGSEVLSQQSPQVAYRLNLVRQQLMLDQQPTMGSVLVYAEHVQAEAEGLMASGCSGTVVRTQRVGNAPGKPAVKALGNTPNTPAAGTPAAGGKGVGSEETKPNVPCKFWGTTEGCKKADKCRFLHSRLNPKDGRCFLCSGAGHNKSECPHANGDGLDGKKKVAKTKGSKGESKGDGKKGIRKG